MTSASSALQGALIGSFCPVQDKRAVERLEVEKAFHPFIAGPYNRLVGEIMQETGTRINIPPPSVNRTEIVFTGEKEQLAQAVARIKKIYEEKVRCGGGRAGEQEQLMGFECGNLANPIVDPAPVPPCAQSLSICVQCLVATFPSWPTRCAVGWCPGV